MRLRIQSFPPLPELKAWFIPDVPTPLQKVTDLKEAICLRISVLKDAGIAGRDVVLLLDDFELLNDTPFSAVRDGDLICVKPVDAAQLSRVSLTGVTSEAAAAEPLHSRKRKRSSTVLKKPGQFITKPRTPLSSKHRVSNAPSESSDESSSSESSSSSSSSCSSSSNTSSSSSKSSSPSSSSSSSPPTPQPSKLAKKPRLSAPASVPSQPTSTTLHVPPGLGKPITHNRNLRRRLKKKLDKEEASKPTAPKGSSETNLLPLGQKPHKALRDRHGPAGDVASALNNAFGSNDDGGELAPGALMDVDDDDEDAVPSVAAPSQPVFSNNSQTPGPVLMASLGNKNKRRGFKQSLSAPVPKKIVFSQDHVQTGDAPPPQANTNGHGHAHPRLVPPSVLQERGELPANVFVTSVDVEAGMWEKKGKKKSKRKEAERYQAGDWGGDSWYDESQAAIDPDTSYAEEVNGVDQLPYGEPEEVADGSATTVKFDWNRAEKMWEQFKELQHPEQLSAGGLVGWKALALNPQTFTPEVLLMVGRVLRVQDGSTGKLFTIRLFLRPVEGEAAFAFGFAAEGAQGDEDGDEITYEWTQVMAEKWRLVEV